MHQRRAEVRLVDELRDDGRLARQLGAQALDDEGAAEALGAERHRRVDLRHPAFAQQIEQPVAAEADGPDAVGGRARRGRPAGCASVAPKPASAGPRRALRSGAGPPGVEVGPAAERRRRAVRVSTAGRARPPSRRSRPPAPARLAPQADDQREQRDQARARPRCPAVVRGGGALGLVRGGGAARERPEPQPGHQRADGRRPGAVLALVDRPARLRADRRAQQLALGSAPGLDHGARAVGQQHGAARLLGQLAHRRRRRSASPAPAPPGSARPGSSTPAAAAAYGQPLPMTISATASLRSRASRMSRSEAKSAVFIPSMTSSLSPSNATA